MGTLEKDIIQRADDLKAQRYDYEVDWRESARLVLPSNPDIVLHSHLQGEGMRVLSPNADEAHKIYDSTAIWATRRLASGIESLQMPSSEKWHGLKVDNFFSPKPTLTDKKFFERVTDYLFQARYHAKSNFSISNQHAIRQSIVFGTGLYMVLPNKGEGRNQRPFMYTGKLLGRCYLDVDGMDNHDTFYERCYLTARQIVSLWGPQKTPKHIIDAANDNDRKDFVFEIIHAIQPRAERGSRKMGENNRNSEFASYVVDVGSETLIEESGFFEFPVCVYTWDRVPGQPYGQGPIAENKPDIKTVNVMSKTALSAGQQLLQPPMGVPHGGMFNRLNLNSNAINPGTVNDQGQLLAKPLVSGINPAFGQEMMEQRRGSIRQGLFVDLFQILVNAPNLTATEALIRADEKGQLLGPIGTNLQRGLATLVDREMGIVGRMGAFRPDAPFALPETIQGKEFSPNFTSPLDRARRSQEVLGIQRTIEGMIPIAQVDPTVMEVFDFDAIARITSEVNGAPAAIMKDPETVKAARAQREQAQQLQQQLGAGQQVADIASTGVPAANESAELLRLIGNSGGAGINNIGQAA